jgi:1-acyl-sn-glycerol-3-phosphate acyltransferase
MRRIVKTAYEYFALWSSLALLGIICLTWSVFAIPLYFILPERLGTRVGRAGITYGFRIYAWSLAITRTYYLDIKAVDSLRGGPPLILAPNHPALIDALLILTRHPNLVCVMKSQLMNNVFLGSGSRLARYVRNDSSRQLVKESVKHLKGGGVLLLFPEGTRSVRFPVNDTLVNSVGLIAKHAKVPVQTLLIETDSPFLSKGWPLFKRPRLPIIYKVRLGQRFDPPEDVPGFTARLDAYYRQELQHSLQSSWLKQP